MNEKLVVQMDSKKTRIFNIKVGPLFVLNFIGDI